jgi:ABC-type sulfate transport system permease subunit
LLALLALVTLAAKTALEWRIRAEERSLVMENVMEEVA